MQKLGDGFRVAGEGPGRQAESLGVAETGHLEHSGLPAGRHPVPGKADSEGGPGPRCSLEHQAVCAVLFLWAEDAGAISSLLSLYPE